MAAITVENLSKSYSDVHAVRGISFAVDDGSLFAFLGKNGAGKSTTIGCITTTLGFDAGHVEVAGHDVSAHPDQVHADIGVVFQNSLLDGILTARENLATRAGFYGLSRAQGQQRIAELTDLVALDGFLDQRYGTLSGGQKRRVDVARALIHRPRVLFLDEPTAGLDPQSREQVWGALARLRHEQGMTVFLTTHYMEETERADQVCIIDAGAIVAQGTPAALRSQHSRSTLTMTSADMQILISRLSWLGLHPTMADDGLRVSVEVKSGLDGLRVLKSVEDGLTDFEFRHGTMDDVFLSSTHESLPAQDSLDGRRNSRGRGRK